MKTNRIFIPLMAILAVAAPQMAQAQAFNLIGKVPCATRGDCKIDEIIAGFGVLMNWAVSISGAIALLLFIVGGVYLLASAGRAEWVKRGKDILVGTSTALFFIFSSWLIVSFILGALGTQEPFRLQPGLPNTTPISDQARADIFCQQTGNEGSTCGAEINNMVCDNDRCITKCKKTYFTAINRYECRPKSYCQFPNNTSCDANPGNCRSGENLCPPKSYLNPNNTEDLVCCFQVNS